MARFIVTVRTRWDSEYEVEAKDHAIAADVALALAVAGEPPVCTQLHTHTVTEVDLITAKVGTRTKTEEEPDMGSYFSE